MAALVGSAHGRRDSASIAENTALGKLRGLMVYTLDHSWESYSQPPVWPLYSYGSAALSLL